MKVTVTARHHELTEPMRERAQEIVDKLGKVAHRPQRADVVFEQDHQQCVAEIRMQLPRGVVRVASGEADDFRTALDRAAEKLRRQLDKSEAGDGPRAARRATTT